MDLFSDIERRRATNVKKLAGLGVHSALRQGSLIRVIREGSGPTIFTVGYERRDVDGLLSVLRDQGIKALADIRENPISRKREFCFSSLQAACQAEGIEYQPWPMLGSTVEQREELQRSGDFSGFADCFREHAKRTMMLELARLAVSATRIPTALLCYERLHEECHRSIIAELLAEKSGATIVAIL